MHVSQRSIGPSDRPLFSKKRSIRDQLFVVLLSLFIDELHHQFIIIQLIKKMRRIYHVRPRFIISMYKLISIACSLMPLFACLPDRIYSYYLIIYLSSSLPAITGRRRARQDRAQVLRATSRTRSPVSCTCPGRQSAGSTGTASPARSHLPPTPAVTTSRSCSGPAGARGVRHVTTPRLRTRAMGRHDDGGAPAAVCAISTAAMSVCPPWYRKLMARCAGCLLPSSSTRTDRFLFLYSQGILYRSRLNL